MYHKSYGHLNILLANDKIIIEAVHPPLYSLLKPESSIEWTALNELPGAQYPWNVSNSCAACLTYTVIVRQCDNVTWHMEGRRGWPIFCQGSLLTCQEHCCSYSWFATLENHSYSCGRPTRNLACLALVDLATSSRRFCWHCSLNTGPLNYSIWLCPFAKSRLSTAFPHSKTIKSITHMLVEVGQFCLIGKSPSPMSSKRALVVPQLNGEVPVMLYICTWRTLTLTSKLHVLQGCGR